MQVCATLGEKVVNSRPQLSPNEISDHLITRIRSSMKDRYILELSLGNLLVRSVEFIQEWFGFNTAKNYENNICKNILLNSYVKEI
jgi:hypothetical protein